MAGEPKYMTIQEAADYLGITRRRIWVMVKEGQLTAITNPVDRREKLIARSELEPLAQFSKRPAA